MSNVVNSAFTTIRAASGLTDQRPPLKTVKVKSIIMGPFVKPWRHPIWWWKMRHMRRDIRVLDKINPDLSSRMREIEEEHFVNGTGR